MQLLVVVVGDGGMKHAHGIFVGAIVAVIVIGTLAVFGCTLLEIHYHAPETGRPEIEITIPEINHEVA